MTLNSLLSTPHQHIPMSSPDFTQPKIPLDTPSTYPQNSPLFDNRVPSVIMLAPISIRWQKVIKKASSDVKQYTITRTFSYVMLCLIGVIILLIAVLAGLHEFTSWLLTIIGAAMASTGTIYLIDKIFFYQDKIITSLRWKIGRNIVGFLKGTLFEIDVIIIAATYVYIVLKIAIALSLNTY